jgi:YHS domain-containing protein
MFRNVFRLFLVLVAVLFVRQVIVLIARAFSQSQSQAGGGGTGQPRPDRNVASGGELRKDPVCGTFVAVASSIKQDVDGQVVHFCSTACRDKYRAA